MRAATATVSGDTQTWGRPRPPFLRVLVPLDLPLDQPHAARHVDHLEAGEVAEDRLELHPLELERRVPDGDVEPRPAERRDLPRGERIVGVRVAGGDHHLHPHAVAADPLDEIPLRRHADGDPDAAVVRRRGRRTAGGEGERQEERRGGPSSPEIISDSPRRPAQVSTPL